MTSKYPYALSLEHYRKLMDRDYARLYELAEESLAAAVPACAGWNGEELLRHTALVYLQKAETIRTEKKPSGAWVPDEVRRMEAVQMLDECYNRLIEQFESHNAGDPAETWVPGDQTVGFWIRRLAHETSIHRYDVEAALGRTTPVDEELAIDGIDEVLTVMLGRGAPDAAASGATVVLESADKAWSATLNTDSVAVRWEGTSSPAGRITGEPHDVLLWLWGRAPLPHGSTDNAAIAELRGRLASAT